MDQIRFREQIILYSVAIFFGVIICFVAVYYALGGFEKLKVYSFPALSRTVVGKYYSGDLGEEEVKKIIHTIKQNIYKKKLQGKPTVVFNMDLTPDKKKRLFIGASFDSIISNPQIPTGYTYETFSTFEVYRIFVTQHALIRPPKTKFYDLMVTKALKEKKVLQSYFFDIYYEDGSKCIEACIH